MSKNKNQIDLHKVLLNISHCPKNKKFSRLVPLANNLFLKPPAWKS
jgi:hypothetical protein